MAKRKEKNHGVPDLTTGWLGNRHEIALGIVETLIHPSKGPRPKKMHPDLRGFAGKVMESIHDGFRALSGGRLYLLDSYNKKAASLRMEDALVIRVLGWPVIHIHKDRAHLPVLEVGAPGRSWIELYMANGEKRYVSITASGRLSVRKTPPEREI